MRTYLIEIDGTTSRGCATSDDINTCNTDNCNSGIFPEDRLSCYQCTDCSSTSLQNSEAPLCSLYKDDQNSCYTYYDGIVNYSIELIRNLIEIYSQKLASLYNVDVYQILMYIQIV